MSLAAGGRSPWTCAGPAREAGRRRRASRCGPASRRPGGATCARRRGPRGDGQVLGRRERPRRGPARRAGRGRAGVAGCGARPRRTRVGATGREPAALEEPRAPRRRRRLGGRARGARRPRPGAGRGDRPRLDGDGRPRGRRAVLLRARGAARPTASTAWSSTAATRRSWRAWWGGVLGTTRSSTTPARCTRWRASGPTTGSPSTSWRCPSPASRPDRVHVELVGDRDALVALGAVHRWDAPGRHGAGRSRGQRRGRLRPRARGPRGRGDGLAAPQRPRPARSTLRWKCMPARPPRTAPTRLTSTRPTRPTRACALRPLVGSWTLLMLLSTVLSVSKK